MQRAPDDESLPSARAELWMTEDEFVAWCDEDVDAEWVDGRVLVREPVSGDHDELAWWLRSLLQHHATRRGLGLVRGPQFAVRLAAQRSRREPDVLFVATHRRDVVRPNHVEGAPDLVIEVVSPDSQSRDRREKYAEYEAAGVAEYWIVDPLSRTVEAYALVGGRYAPIPAEGGRIASRCVPGWYLLDEWLWGEPMTDVLDALAELGAERR